MTAWIELSDEAVEALIQCGLLDASDSKNPKAIGAALITYVEKNRYALRAPAFHRGIASAST